MSYAYHAISSYFNRDNVALPGFVTYFRDASIEERDHAQMLMDFQVRSVYADPADCGGGGGGATNQQVSSLLFH